MKLIVYKCKECDFSKEDLFYSSEEIPEELEELCPKCKKKLYKFNIKNNSHRWHFRD